METWLELEEIYLSRPAWGAWIEICVLALMLAASIVAPRMGRVD